jgi:murein DD-endopeptidase MepM/ murein hydrolase activator NlpD
MDDRRLTFIVVPHGDLETKTVEISYRRLRVLGWSALAIVLILVFLIAFWWSVAAQAARVPGLEGELKRFERERAKVDSLAHLLAQVEDQYERVRQMLGADAPADGRPAMLPELPKNEKSEGTEAPIVDSWPLGTERGFITRGLTKDTNHPGLDIAVPQSSYIRAAGAGTVVEAGSDEIYGQHLRIDHGGGLESLYGHASRLLVKAGDQIKRQQVIALSGNTGRSTAPHLHFEIRQNGIAVDPLRFVRQP